MNISFRLSNRLDFLAQQTGRTKAFYIREMIVGKIDEMEDYYLAADRMERVRKGKEKVLTDKEVRKELIQQALT